MRWVSLIAMGLWAFPLVPALILVVFAETWQGRGLGLAIVLVAVALVGGARRNRRLLGGALFIALLIISLLFVASPAPVSGPRFGSYFLAGAHQRLALASLVPEIDQIVVGLKLVSYVDPIISGDAAEKLAAVVLPIYRGMDPEMDALGSEMGQAYDDIWQRDFDVGHYYLATPPKGLAGSPAIIFVHGSAGNFKSYLWALRSLSQEHGFVVAHPSFGFGMWSRKGGVEAIERVRQKLIADGVDRDRIYLVGLSNGGLGVSLTAVAHPAHYRGFGFISPVFADGVEKADWNGRNALILEGREDDRVPVVYVDHMVEVLRAKGAVVDYQVYDGQDHFLLFSSLDRALADIVRWLSL